MNIRISQGCAQGYGIFASFAGMEDSDILPLPIVTQCHHKSSKKCNIDDCPRFKYGWLGSHKISWRNEGARNEGARI